MKQDEHMEEIFEKYVSARFDSVANKAYYDYICAEILNTIGPTMSSGLFLELMCGTGELMARYSTPPTVRKVGLDLTSRMLAHGSKHHAGAGQFVCGDARRLPFADATVQVIVIQGGLHHVARHLDEVLKEIGRVLAPNGKLVCIEPCNDNWIVAAIRWCVYQTFKIFDPAEERGLRRGELETGLSKAGLVMEQYRPVGYAAFALIGNTDVLPWCYHLRWQPAIRFLIWSDDVLARVPVVRRLGWLCLFRARKNQPTSSV